MPSRRTPLSTVDKFQELMLAAKKWPSQPVRSELIDVGGRQKLVMTDAAGGAKVVVPTDYVGTEKDAMELFRKIVHVK